MAVRVVTDQAAVEAPAVTSRWGILGTVGRGLAGNRKALAGLALFGFFLLVALLAPLIAPYDPHALQFSQMLQPSRTHLLGTTGTGQDIFSQLVFGTRESLLIALGAGLGATVVAVIIGVSAAYMGGLWDHLLNLFTDVFLVLPTLPLMIIVGSYLHNRGLLVLIGVIVITGWSYGARQLRSQALSLRNREFLEAARARGERSPYIIVFEVLPNMTSLIVAIFFGAALYAVLAAAGLQFIGLGDPNSLSWGTMLYWAQANGALLAGSPVWVLAPGLCIAALGAAFALINYAFDEISNPALRATPGARRARSPGARRALPDRTEEVITAATRPLLQVRGLSVDYLTEHGPVRAVDGVTLDVARGEFLGIVGESGCGKSTLLFAIARLLGAPAEISAGEIWFDGKDMVSMDEDELRHLRWSGYSVVMQSAMNALNPVMTIAEQLGDAIQAHVRMRDRQLRSRSQELLKVVGIDPVHLQSYPHQLSGGMRQRAMIAMALALTPDLVIMDEPTSALDVVAQRSLMLKIKQLQREFGFATIFVTHDMSLVSHFSDRLAVMYAGQVVEVGQTRQVFASPKHPYTAGLMRSFPSISGPLQPLAGIPGTPPDLAHPPSGCRFHPRCPKRFDRCPGEEPILYASDEALVRCFLFDDR